MFDYCVNLVATMPQVQSEAGSMEDLGARQDSDWSPKGICFPFSRMALVHSERVMSPFSSWCFVYFSQAMGLTMAKGTNVRQVWVGKQHFVWLGLARSIWVVFSILDLSEARFECSCQWRLWSFQIPCCTKASGDSPVDLQTLPGKQHWSCGQLLCTGIGIGHVRHVGGKY